MTCPKCGSQLSPGQNFCMNCGSSLSAQFAAPPRQGESQAPANFQAPPQQYSSNFYGGGRQYDSRGASSKHIAALITSLAIVPITLILRIVTQKTSKEFGAGAWMESTASYVPNDVIPMMLFLVFILAGTAIALSVTDQTITKSKKWTPVIIAVVSSFLSFPLITAHMTV